MNRHSAVTTAAVFAAALALAPAASAATTRFVTTGGLNSAACTEAAPCDLPKAASIATAGDTIRLAAGTHLVIAPATINAAGVDVVGAPGTTRPKIQLTGPGAGVSFGPAAVGSKLHDVNVDNTGGGGIFPAVTAAASVTVSDVDITAGGACVSFSASGSTLENAKLTTAAAALPNACVSTLPTADNVTIRNVDVTSGASAFPGTPAVSLLGAGNTVDRLTTSGPGGVSVGTPAIPSSGAPTTIRRSRITTSTAALFIASPALIVFHPSVVTDTVVRSDGTAALPGASAMVGAANLKLRNVTAVSSAPLSTALLLQPATTSPAVSIKNSILRGQNAAADITVVPGAPAIFPPGDVLCTTLPSFCLPTITPDVTVDHSNFRGATGTLVQSDNQTTDPQFTDASAGDFRPKAGSPVIDAGVDDADNGTTDLAGVARKQGAAVDIGAFEFPVAPPPANNTQQPQQPQQQQQPTAPSGGGEPVITPPAPDLLSPALSRLAITNKKFAVARGATSLTPARAKKGTTFVFTVSEPAAVTITIQRATSGRRKGRSCVKETRKNRRAKKCTRYVKAGRAIVRDTITGANAVPFSGRLGKKALKPGKYRAVFAARDASGNAAKKKPAVSFKVVKK